MSPTTQYAHNGAVALAYEAFGDLDRGEPLLLMMGLDFQMVWWPDAFCHQLVAAGFAVVRFDNRDTGLSVRPDPEAAYTGEDMLDDAGAVLDAVGWDSAHVLGGSMGAALGQALALLRPERVRTLVSCMGMPATVGPLRMLGYLHLGLFPAFLRVEQGPGRDGQIATLVEIYRLLASPGYPFPAEWARRTAEISHDRRPRDPAATRRQLAAGRTLRLPPLSGITAPTLVISGQDDPLVRVRAGRDTARQIPGATFVSCPGMGHSLPEELWSEVIAHIRATAARHPARGPVGPLP